MHGLILHQYCWFPTWPLGTGFGLILQGSKELKARVYLTLQFLLHFLKFIEQTYVFIITQS